MSDKAHLPRTVVHKNGDYELINKDGETVLLITAAEMDSIVSDYEAHILGAVRDCHKMDSPLQFLTARLINMAHERGALAALLRTLICECELKARP